MELGKSVQNFIRGEGTSSLHPEDLHVVLYKKSISKRDKKKMQIIR